jgi:hypothetical protein
MTLTERSHNCRGIPFFHNELATRPKARSRFCLPKDRVAHLNSSIGTSILKEESVPDAPSQVLLSFLALTVSASGEVSLPVALAISVLIVAVAWRVIKS